MLENYTKPALKFNQQLQKLKNRGLLIDSDELALFHLRTISYYRLSAFQKCLSVFQSPEFFGFHYRLHPPMLYPILSVAQTHFSLENTDFLYILVLY